MRILAKKNSYLNLGKESKSKSKCPRYDNSNTKGEATTEPKESKDEIYPIAP